MLRFSIRQLLAATAVVAFGCFALVKASPIVAASTTGIVALILVAAAFLAIYRAGDKRAFWLGFATFGWTYLLLCYGPIFTENNSPFGLTRLITAQLATALYDRIHGPAVVQPTVVYTTTFAPLGAPPPLPPTPGVPQPAPSWPVTLQMAAGSDRSDFLNVAHSLWALSLAFCGGWFALWASRSRNRS